MRSSLYATLLTPCGVGTGPALNMIHPHRMPTLGPTQQNLAKRDENQRLCGMGKIWQCPIGFRTVLLSNHV
jgi:hypothetical protein